MKNKGFTLVELLAVIAILAILVIVAMPNVLGMFNQAKVNSFTTEVQKLMDTATTTFTKDALLNSGKSVYYSNVDNATLNTKKLDMSGNEKNYFIEMDRNGEFKRVIVYDDNFCYDIYASGTNGNLSDSKSKFMVDDINKTSVVSGDIWESGNDNVSITMNGSNYIVTGCEGLITTEGKDTNVVLDTVKINGVEYKYIPGMTWEQWIASEYNTGNYRIASNGYIESSTNSKYILTSNCVCDETSCYIRYYSRLNDEIIKNEKYGLFGLGADIVVTVEPGDKFYDLVKSGGSLIYEQELITSDTYR